MNIYFKAILGALAILILFALIIGMVILSKGIFLICLGLGFLHISVLAVLERNETFKNFPAMQVPPKELEDTREELK